jgi:colanic acid/amylovoran biosynthesis glycosyltransferase
VIRTTTSNGLVIQRCDRFVARTMNWLYDHLRCVPKYDQLVVCDALENRQEFPALDAVHADPRSLARSVWRRIARKDVDPLLARRLRRRAPHILHSHFGYVAANDYPLWEALGAAWVVGFYGADVYALGRLEQWRRRYAAIFAGCARVLALGPVMAEHLARLGCAPEKIVVHPLGVDIAELHDTPRRRAKGEPLRVLFAGTLREKKGLKYALEGAAAAKEAGVKIELHVIGEATNKPGDRETELDAVKVISDLKLDDSVVRYQFVAFRELHAMALRSHVFLAPSVTAADGDSEGTPFVLQQMMATGMPVIATRHADIPYLFGEHQSLLVAERDSDAIAKQLIEYDRNPDLLVEHGGKLRRQIADHFDVRACAARLADIYGELR